MTGFFRNKVVVVTGGTEGIGRALVNALMEGGAKVATCGRNQDKLYALQTTYAGKSLHTLVADVSRFEDCQRLISSTVSTFGGIDILINNAAISMRALVEDLDISVIRKVMDVNFYGSVYCSQLALPYIKERKGTIAAISSVAAYRALPGRSAYSASKAALQGFLEALRTELMDSQVNVMWVSPGFVSSNIRKSALNHKGEAQGESMFDEGNMMSAEECASHVLKAIEKRRRTLALSFTTKRAILMNRFFPSLTDKLVHRMYFQDGKLVK